jgi:hypothetical protein
MLSEGREQLDGLGDPQPAGQRRVLQLGADALPQLRRLACRVQPEHPNRASIRTAQTLGALDGGRLAGAVRAEDPEDLTMLNRERHIVDRKRRAMCLAEMRNLDDRLGRRSDNAPKGLGHHGGFATARQASYRDTSVLMSSFRRWRDQKGPPRAESLVMEEKGLRNSGRARD